MDWSRQERIEIHDRLVAMLDDVRKEIMAKYPDVVSVDVGLKQVKGQPQQIICFRLHVKQKKPLSQLKPQEVLPSAIAGILTDVKVDTPYYINADTGSYDPMWGGVGIKTQEVPISGTLGCFVTLNADGKAHLLSNHHILKGSTGAIGKLVGQPTEPDDTCCCCICGDIAKVVDTEDNASVDCGIAILLDKRFSNNILQIGPIFGDAPAIIGDIVRKRGASSELTWGVVMSTMESPNVPINGLLRTNQIEVMPDPIFPEFGTGGDSGAVYVNNLNQIIGLHFSSNRVPGPDNSALGNHISEVKTALGISIPSAGTLGAIPLSGIAAEPILTANPHTFIHQIEQKLKRSEPGQKLLQAIRDNRHEVMDLINDNREVKVAWNRYNGPSYIGHLMKNAREPQHSIPKDIQGYSFNNLLIKMSDVLERHGSRKLAKAVEDYSVVAFDFAHEYTGAGSLDSLLEKHSFCPQCGTIKNPKRHA